MRAGTSLQTYDVRDLSAARRTMTFAPLVSHMIALDPSGVAFTASNHLYVAAQDTLALSQSPGLDGTAGPLVQLANGEVAVRAGTKLYTFSPRNLAAATHEVVFGDVVNHMIALDDGRLALTSLSYLYVYAADLQSRAFTGDLGGSAQQLVQIKSGEIVLKGGPYLYSYTPTNLSVSVQFANFGSEVSGMTALVDGGIALTSGSLLYRFDADLQSSTVTGDLGGPAGAPVQMTNGDIAVKAANWIYAYSPAELSTYRNLLAFSGELAVAIPLKAGGIAFGSGNVLHRTRGDLSGLESTADLGAAVTHLVAKVVIKGDVLVVK